MSGEALQRRHIIANLSRIQVKLHLSHKARGVLQWQVTRPNSLDASRRIVKHQITLFLVSTVMQNDK